MAEAGPVELVLVGSQWSQSYAVWRQMLNERDYLGSGPLAGHQLRYLIRGPGARLGALAFGVAALQVEARDRWIGWSAELWRENLPDVINQSRFLILPWVGVEKLASHIPGLVISRVAAVWLERLGYGPVLAETFVDLERCRGACYQAANLKWVRMTRGRGRQDRDRSQKPVETAALGPSLGEGFSPGTVRRARHPTFGVQSGQTLQAEDRARRLGGGGVWGGRFGRRSLGLALAERKLRIARPPSEMRLAVERLIFLHRTLGQIGSTGAAPRTLRLPWSTHRPPPGFQIHQPKTHPTTRPPIHGSAASARITPAEAHGHTPVFQ